MGFGVIAGNYQSFTINTTTAVNTALLLLSLAVNSVIKVTM